MDVSTHNNGEGVIRCYMYMLPPKPSESILDIGSGITAPWRGILSARCQKYVSLDIRKSDKVDIVCDITEQSIPFADKSFQWGWCVECIEHIRPQMQHKFLNEILRVCENLTLCYPTIKHPTFSGDPGHNIVSIDWKKYTSMYRVVNFSTKTGRNRFVFSKKDSNILLTSRGFFNKR